MGRPKKDKRQLSIHAAFGATSSKDAREASFDLNSIVVEDEALIENENELENPSKKPRDTYVRNFLPAWRMTFPWAYPLIDDDGNERIKCKVCSELKVNTPFGDKGSKTIQKQALEVHQKSEAHKRAKERLNWQKQAPSKVIEKHVDLMLDAEKSRIVSMIQILWFVAKHDMSLESFEELCHFHMYMRTPNMPLSNEYSSYTNSTAGKEFLEACYLFYWESLRKEICASPFFSIMVDESTDRRYEKHLIIYITYLSKGGYGECKTKYVRLARIRDGKAQSMVVGIKQLIDDMHLNEQKMVGFASDGASAMVGVNEGVVAKLKRLIPHLVGVHCIAHRENLVVKDACENFVEFVYLDKFANKIREWLGESTLRREELLEVFDAFQLKHYQLLKIHGVRWLSRGKVISRLVTIMPALLSHWKEKNVTLYTQGIKFQVQFLIHFLADVLKEIDILNLKFQDEHVDITNIGRDITVVIDTLKDRYLGDYFGAGSKHLKEFLRKSQSGIFKCDSKEGEMIEHILKNESLPNSTRQGDIEGCILLAKDFIRELLLGFDERFGDCHLFNAGKLFSPKNYPSESRERGNFSRQFLDWLCDRFANGPSSLVDKDECETELPRFVATLLEAYPTKGLFDTWIQCGSELEWRQMFPELFKLWQIVLVLPASSVMCERGFSKQNRIKSHDRSSICLKTLDRLMFISLSTDEKLEDVNWEGIFEVWKSMKERRPQSLS